MKILKVFLLNFFFLLQPFFLPTNAQGEETYNFLFLFGQIDVDSTTNITHTLTVVGSYWELDNNDYLLSDDSELEIATASITGSTSSVPTIPDDDYWKGFVFPWVGSPYEYTDDIAYGFYKITNSYNNDYFYIDIRDCKYRGVVSGSYNPDFFIRYDDDEDKFQWLRSGFIWNDISTGEVLNV